MINNSQNMRVLGIDPGIASTGYGILNVDGNQRLKVEGTQSFSTPYFYELAGNSCLQGDIIGEYFFLKKLEVGDEVVFEDMMGYSMVKMTEFNGMENASFIVE